MYAYTLQYTGIFTKKTITPLSTVWAGIFAKSGSLMNPIVYGISHPKYRAALQKKYPALACANEPPLPGDDAQSTATTGGSTGGDVQTENA
jgi:r-opsin